QLQDDPRLSELSLGRWEGLTVGEVGARDREVLAARELDKWRPAETDGESYEQVAVRLRGWLATLSRDAVVVAHGGTMRALVVELGVASQETAFALDPAQGVVYRFADKTMSTLSGEEPAWETTGTAPR